MRRNESAAISFAIEGVCARVLRTLELVFPQGNPRLVASNRPWDMTYSIRASVHWNQEVVYYEYTVPPLEMYRGDHYLYDHMMTEIPRGLINFIADRAMHLSATRFGG